MSPEHMDSTRYGSLVFVKALRHQSSIFQVPRNFHPVESILPAPLCRIDATG